MDVIRFDDLSFQWHVTGGWERNFNISHVRPAGADKAVRLERDAIQMDRQMPWVGHIQWLIIAPLRDIKRTTPHNRKSLLFSQQASRTWDSDKMWDTGRQ